MDNQIQVFNHPTFGDINTVKTENGNVLFKANDVAGALGYTQPAVAICKHCKGVTVLETPSAKGLQPTKYIGEPDVYRLVMRSKLPDAEKFQDWVCEEVLPSIRRNGAYMTDNAIEQALADPDFGIKLLTRLKEEQGIRRSLEAQAKEQRAVIAQKEEMIAERESRIAEMEESSAYCDIVLNCKDLVDITQISQDYGTTAIRMNRYLKSQGLQYKDNDQWILYAQYKGQGYVHSYTRQITPDKSKMCTKWTQKGRLFLYKFLKSRGVLPVLEQGEGYRHPAELQII